MSPRLTPVPRIFIIFSLFMMTSVLTVIYLNESSSCTVEDAQTKHRWTRHAFSEENACYEAQVRCGFHTRVSKDCRVLK